MVVALWYSACLMWVAQRVRGEGKGRGKRGKGKQEVSTSLLLRNTFVGRLVRQGVQ